MLRSHRRRAGVWRIIVAGVLVAACQTDASTRPAARESLGLSTEGRGQLEAAVRFAGEQPILGLPEREARDHLARSFADVARQVVLDDRRGVEQAVAEARSAIEQYQRMPDAGDAAIELAALTFTLDHALELAKQAPKGRRRSPPIEASREERRP